MDKDAQTILNAQNDAGDTLLHLVAEQLCARYDDSLLETEANDGDDTPCSKDFTELYIARVQRLIEMGASTTIANHRGLTVRGMLLYHGLSKRFPNLS